MWAHLSRIRGGPGMRGPGETQLETDRRLIGKRVKTLTERLQKIKQQRETGRQQRAEIPVPSLALVGYTNAGKSTLFRALTGADAYVADQLFATLDPTVRRIVMPGNTQVVVADTVGFIRELPHELVAAFQSTLTEARGATLLLHVVDAADPRRDEHIDEVNRVLAEIGAAELPQILVYNKIDRLGVEPRIERDESGRASHVWLSAVRGQGLDLLREAVAERLSRVARRATLRLSVAAGELRARLYAAGLVRQERIGEDGAFEIDTELSEFELLKWAREPGVELVSVSGPAACTPAEPYLQSSPALRSSP
jgi:GTP-binding protein HflX